jgi:1,2-diacylglycerol 3-alpha-glucosyltransferase
MIFVASALVMNGGTTFLVRTCRELARRGRRPVVLAMTQRADPALASELARHATLLHLDDYLVDRGRLARSLLATFAPLDLARLRRDLAPGGPQLHAMGVFGLLLAERLAAPGTLDRVTVGIYHQNEFLFRGLPFHVATEAQRRFAALPPRNVVFFNEATRANYERGFSRSWRDATVVPIGIDLPPADSAPPLRDPARIVSIGNLVPFKTYTRHVIEMLPELARSRPDVRYDVVGSGPEEPALRALAAAVGVAERVRFHGTIPYAAFAAHVGGAAVFVGSGTALLEAAALGVPALVGIESIDVPETYGWLADITGLSYNERIPGVPLVAMRPLIERVLGDPAAYASVRAACLAKVRAFSVASTVDGLLSLDTRAAPVAAHGGSAALLRLAASTVTMAAIGRLVPSLAFAGRRDQSA